MTFPPFSDYQDTFSSPLTPSMFATFTVPTWIPQPAQLLRLAKVIYPYWRDRRVERKGHRIIPDLNVSITFNSVNGIAQLLVSSTSRTYQTSLTFASVAAKSKLSGRRVPHKQRHLTSSYACKAS
jgi:hypothetical protein